MSRLGAGWVIAQSGLWELFFFSAHELGEIPPLEVLTNPRLVCDDIGFVSDDVILDC